MSIYLKQIPEDRRKDAEVDLKRQVGLCANCRMLVPINGDWGCGNPEIAAMRPKYPIEACGLYDPV